MKRRRFDDGSGQDPFHYGNSQDPFGPYLGQADPLTYALGNRYADFMWRKLPNKGNELLRKLNKPTTDFVKKYDPIRKTVDKKVPWLSKGLNWIENKPGTTLGLLAGAVFAGKGLASIGGGGGGGGGGGAGAGQSAWIKQLPMQMPGQEQQTQPVQQPKRSNLLAIKSNPNSLQTPVGRSALDVEQRRRDALIRALSGDMYA